MTDYPMAKAREPDELAL